ncbi:FadR/GntR family transcriptional regulator [soil metagenome]
MMAHPFARLHSDKALSSHDQIARAIGSEILRGVYAPGANLPPEQDLLDRFGVSRTVLREVSKTLSAKGLVVAKTRVGTKVLDPVHWNYFDADLLGWKVSLGLDHEFRQSLVEIRRAIEPPAAALAAERRTEADLVVLRRTLAVMAQPNHGRLSFAEADLEFHLAIGAASGNPLMRSIAAVIETALLAAFQLSSPADDLALHGTTVDQHAAILDAIEQGDAVAAAARMLSVINDGHERIERELDGKA